MKTTQTSDTSTSNPESIKLTDLGVCTATQTEHTDIFSLFVSPVIWRDGRYVAIFPRPAVTKGGPHHEFVSIRCSS